MKKTRKPSPSPVLVLPPERIVPGEAGAPFPLMQRWTGKWQAKSTVAYAITLPLLPGDAPDLPTVRLRDAFLRFLRKEAEKERDTVWFGGLDMTWENGAYRLCAAFCPFADRQYLPRARLRFSPEGALLGIETVKVRRKGRSG